MATKDEILRNKPEEDKTTSEKTEVATSQTANGHQTETAMEKPKPNLSAMVQKTEPPKRLSYATMYQKLSPYKPPTEEELAKEKKKQKREAVFAAIGDGISALSNLYFASKGAPNMLDPTNGMSAAAKKRFDKTKAEREANQRQYMDGYLRALAMDEDAAEKERNWKNKLERQKRDDERADRKEAREVEMAELDRKLKGNQITIAEYKAEQERIAAKFAPEYEQSRIDKNKASAGASKASASASNARAGYYNRGGSGGSGKKPSLKIGKETFKYDTTQDYDRAVEGYAQQYGINIYDEVLTRSGRVKERKRKPTAQIAAEVEAKAAEQSSKKPNHMGDGESSNKKKNPMS